MRHRTAAATTALAALIVALLAPKVFALTIDQAAAKLQQIWSHPKLADARVGFLAADVTDGQVIYELNPTESLVPASNAKLATTAAALLTLGADYIFRTAVYAGGPVSSKGVVDGPLLVAGSADPTADGDLSASLAAELARRGYHGAGGVLVNRPLTADRDDSLQASSQRLRAALAKTGVAVVATGEDPPPQGPSSLVIEHASAPLGSIIARIDKNSDNALADRLWRSLGWLVAGAPDRVPDYLRDFWSERGLPMDGVVFADGSGLSRENRTTPLFLVELLRYMAGRRLEWPAFVGSLPIGGEDGTLAARFHKCASCGRVWAKTGTMHDIACLSGYVETDGGGLVAFSSVINDVTGRLQSARYLQQMACDVLASLDGPRAGEQACAAGQAIASAQ